jgi:uncharacterized protein (TIGR04255 family)
VAQVVHLTKAPIVEAVIEFQVDLPTMSSVASAREAHGLFREAYPEAMELMSGSVEFQFGPAEKAKAPTSTSEHMGMRFVSRDGRKIVDFGLKAFAFHWLAPYSEWSEFRTESKRLWEIYVPKMKPKAITRLGVRFINNLAIPQSARDLCDYLVPGPIIPPGLPQSVQSFLSRVEIVDEANKRLGIVTQTLQGLSGDGNLSVLLDVDAVRTGSFAPDDPTTWEIADKLRDFKNQIFFNSVTDKLLEQYR